MYYRFFFRPQQIRTVEFYFSYKRPSVVVRCVAYMDESETFNSTDPDSTVGIPGLRVPARGPLRRPRARARSDYPISPIKKATSSAQLCFATCPKHFPIKTPSDFSSASE